MEDKLRKHIDTLFENAPHTRKTVELKEEMLQNLMEKYNDLINEGKSEETAYNIAVSGIGDVSELFYELEEKMDPVVFEKARQKSAMLTSVAVMLYILSPVASILTRHLGNNASGIAFLVVVAFATGLLVYNSMTKPRYVRNNDTVVEEFKEWKSEKDQRRSLRGAISVALWSITLVLYFVLSFVTKAWYVSWVIFIVAAAVEAIINIFFIARK